MDMEYAGMLAVRQAVDETNTQATPTQKHAWAEILLRGLLGEQNTFSCMLFSLLPWIAVLMFTAGIWGCLNFLGYVLLVTTVGYGLVRVAMPAPARISMLPLSPALGIVAVSALPALWLRMRLPLAGCVGIWIALLAPGAVAIWKDRYRLRTGNIAYGGAVIALSALICLVYFLPSARNDAVLRSDGSFNWIYPDTQHYYAVTESIRLDGRPPKSPGTATAELIYHFGPYVPAAVISRFDGLDLGDAFARVTRGTSIWALIFSTFILGTLLSFRASLSGYGGLMTILGLFFYGSPLALFSDPHNGFSHVTGAILYTIPDINLWADGGPFTHLILGHSLLHGLVAITSIMGLCLAVMDKVIGGRAWYLILLILPALAVPINSVAALYCLGIVAILVFWGRLRIPRTWIEILLMFVLFLLSWKIMGFSQSHESHSAIRAHPAWEWWTVTNAFIVGLGFRIIAFRWASLRRSSSLAILFLATVVGLLSFYLLLALPGGTEHYGIYFLQCMFSIFAFSLLEHGWWRGDERMKWATEWTRLARNGALICAGAGVLLGGYSYIRHQHTGVAQFGPKLVAVLLVAAGLAGTLFVLRKTGSARLGSAAVAVILLAGFTGWIPGWLNYGMGRLKLDVTISAGEVRGLERLHALSRPGARFATNKHDLGGSLVPEAVSYAYAPLAQRPVVLEGYLFRGETALPWFQTLMHDNDLMFTTTDPNELHTLAEKWKVQWLVARPGTDISLPRPLPNWLTEEEATGTLKIYKIGRQPR